MLADMREALLGRGTFPYLFNFNLYLDRSGDYLRPHGELAHGKTPRQDASVGV